MRVFSARRCHLIDSLAPWSGRKTSGFPGFTLTKLSVIRHGIFACPFVYCLHILPIVSPSYCPVAVIIMCLSLLVDPVDETLMAFCCTFRAGVASSTLRRFDRSDTITVLIYLRLARQSSSSPVIAHSDIKLHTVIASDRFTGVPSDADAYIW